MSTNPVTRQLREIIRPLVGLAVITAILLVLAPTFRQGVALRDVFENSTVLFIMAAGTTVVLISGGLDLSIGSILALASVVTGSLLLAEQPVGLALFAGTATGLMCGLINGLIVVKTGIPTLIATLGTALIYRGFGNMIGAGKDMSRFPENFKWLGAGWVGPLVISLITFFAIWFILSKTRLGFNTYAHRRQRGSRPPIRHPSELQQSDHLRHRRVLRRAGFHRADRRRLNFAHVNRGQGMELWAIAAVVIGGTSMFGGIGGVGKTVVGVLIIRVLEAGLIHLHVPSFWQQVATGLVIIIAVWLDFLQRKAREKA